MKKLIQITNRRFGKLKVLSHAGKGFWRARCDCGKEKIVRGPSLRKGYTISCGCQGRGGGKGVLNLAGRRFGKLTVLSYVGRLKGKLLWRVRCDCGTEKIVQGRRLKERKLQTCGSFAHKVEHGVTQYHPALEPQEVQTFVSLRVYQKQSKQELGGALAKTKK